jgi:hypothetical protein
MALFEEDDEGDLMPVLGPAVDTYFELDEEDDLMPRLEPFTGNYPPEVKVAKGVIYGFTDELEGELGVVDFESVPQTTEPV